MVVNHQAKIGRSRFSLKINIPDMDAFGCFLLIPRFWRRKVVRRSQGLTRCQNRNRKSLRAAFTLIEVLLVLVILSVIIGLVVVNIGGTTNNAYKSLAKTQVANLSNHVNRYQLMVGSLPSSLNDLYEQPSNLADPTKWDQVIEKPVPPDPWNHAYEYKVTGADFEIRSFGPDGQANTADDITNKS